MISRISNVQKRQEDTMAADANLLRGECFENPTAIEIPTEDLLIGFITALLEEQTHLQMPRTLPAAPETGEKCG